MPADTPAAAKVPAKDERPQPTHDLLLADGTTVESHGSIPTHVAIGDRVVPVRFVTER